MYKFTYFMMNLIKSIDSIYFSEFELELLSALWFYDSSGLCESIYFLFKFFVNILLLPNYYLFHLRSATVGNQWPKWGFERGDWIKKFPNGNEPKAISKYARNVCILLGVFSHISSGTNQLKRQQDDSKRIIFKIKFFNAK